MDDEDREAIRAGGLDTDSPAVSAALELGLTAPREP
jgi:hypothetical protein